MNPDRRMLGSIRKKPSWIDCVWVRTIVEMKSPSPRLATMNVSVTAYRASTLPRKGTWKSSRPSSRMTDIWM
jgi:hypothetical protein